MPEHLRDLSDVATIRREFGATQGGDLRLLEQTTTLIGAEQP